MRRASLVLAVAAAWALSLAPARPASARVVDGIVAVVNDEPITFSEFRESVAESLGIPVGDADLYLREEKDAARVLQGIETLVDSVLVRQELRKSGQEISEPEIDRAVESVRKNNGLSEADFAAALEKDGISLAGFRRRIRWQMERGAIVRAKRFKDVAVTDEEIREYYRVNAERFLVGAEIRIETLFLPFPPGDQGKEQAVRIRIAAQQAEDSVRAGLSLAEAARLLAATVPGASVVSSDFVKTEDLLPEVQKEVRRLRTGETSPPFFTDAGAYLVTVLARRGGKAPDFASIREALSEELVDRRSEKAYADILAELKKAASIDIRL
ncbi:MAG: peptidyl-prolyl cis-trans isomerase [Gemmatimonadota bacterium]